MYIYQKTLNYKLYNFKQNTKTTKNITQGNNVGYVRNVKCMGM